MNLADLSVLIVDDSQTLRSIFRSMLNASGVLDVVEAENGVDALEVLTHHNPDIIVTDINMKPMDGLTFVAKIRQMSRYRDKPVIMVSSEANEKNILRANELGVKRFLSKPFVQKDLETAIYGSVEITRSEARDTSGAASGKSVLIVDDSAPILKVVTKIVNNLGFLNVLSARSGVDALKMAVDHQPDLILSDVHMGVLSGIQLLEYIRRLESTAVSEVPFILMSSDEAVKEQAEVKKFRASGVLMKPYKSPDLQACLEAIEFPI